MDQQSLGSTPPTVAVASRYGTLWALDARDGSIRWRLTPTGRHPALVHGGDALYVSSHIPLGAFSELDHYNGAPIPPDRPRPIAHAAHADVVALRIGDGTTIWQREGWSTLRATSGAIALDGGFLLSQGPVQAIGDAHIHAFDAHTGAICWTYDASLRTGILGSLLAAHAGRVLVLREEAGPHRHLEALDAQTGALLWSVEATHPVTLSTHGSLIAFVPPSPDGDSTLVVYNAKDGQQLAAQPPQRPLLALSDDGIAYLAGYVPPPRTSSVRLYSGHGAEPLIRRKLVPMISAVRLSDGAEIWHAADLEAGQILTTADMLYYVRLTYPQERGEVIALDIHTGKVLWRWCTPGNLISLLRLWGRRLPQVLVHTLAQARRAIIRAREQHDFGIVRREVLNGQWRRPTHLTSNVHPAVHADAVYLATSMGLFALHPRDGHLLWHALPTSELTQVVASP